MRKRREKGPESVGIRECLGVTMLSTTSGAAAIFMSSLFMQYMTDYAGLGAWGASLATALLLFARIFDAVDDPIQSLIMDNAKVGKHGKYKKFFLIGIILTTVGTILLYSMPSGVVKNPILVTAWVIFFYLVYDIGASFYDLNLMCRTMTDDVNERSKLVVGPRLWTMVLGIIGAMMIAIVVVIYQVVGSYNTAFTILVGAVMLVGAVIALVGWCMVKEKHIVQQEEGEKIHIRDLIDLLKVNKAMVVHFCKNLFAGFIWTLLFATPTYYVKWGYCADLVTGEVDMVKFGSYSAVVSMMMMVPLALGMFIARPLMKKLGSPIRTTRMMLIFQSLGGGILFLAQVAGVLQKVPVLFFFGMFVMALAIGTDFIPQSVVEMEIMDYTIYKTGKDRSALSGVLNKFLTKAQSAVSAALIGAVLMAIGYNVDSVTGDYVGDLANMPSMLNWFIVIMGLLPCLLGIASCVVYKYYPITNEVREDIKKYLAEHNMEGENK